MKKDNNNINSRIDISSDLKFKLIESYKTVRTNLIFSINKSGCKKIAVSSALPNEGKSTVAVNIAISLAQTDVRVLLIDTDLRKARVHRFFNTTNTPGLTNVLGGLNDIEEAIKATDYSNLSIMCSGIIPPNPSELLGSEMMLELINKIEKDYDYIVFDTPPINIVSDPLPVIKNSDGVVIVTKQGTTRYPEVKRAIQSLEFIDAKILGFVLNFVNMKKRKNYGKYGSKYDYRYEYKYKD